MKIYYDFDKYTKEQIVNKVATRLAKEVNTESAVKSWVTRKPTITYTHLSNYVNNAGCTSVDQMLADSEVSYIVTELDSDDDNFAYVGVNS